MCERAFACACGACAVDSTRGGSGAHARRKYQMLEGSLKSQKADNDNRMPDLRSTLDAVELLQATRDKEDDDDDDDAEGEPGDAKRLKVRYELVGNKALLVLQFNR